MNVLPTGAISKNLAGEELAPIGSLAQAGVVAITDDGHCVQNNELMRRAVEYARMVGVPVLDHCQDYNLVGNGVVHEGYWSTLLGLARLAGGGRRSDRRAQYSARGTLRSSHSLPAHQRGRQCAFVARSASARRENQRRSLSASHRADRRVDSEFRHQLQNESAVAHAARHRRAARRNCRWNARHPGERSRAARASSKRKWSSIRRRSEFSDWKRSSGLFIDLLVHKTKTIELPRLIEMFTANPARLLNLDAGNLSLGTNADVTLIDPNLEWTYRRG